MARIEFEWEKNVHGKSILLAKKKRGKISIPELQEAMRDDYRYEGGWAVVFVVREESGYQGWGDSEEPKGDILELHQLGEGENCPVCAAVFVEYCPHCGERVTDPPQ